MDVKRTVQEWEDLLALKQGDEQAVLYRDRDTGRVDWMMALYWRGFHSESREILLRTTAREAVALKRINRS